MNFGVPFWQTAMAPSGKMTACLRNYIFQLLLWFLCLFFFFLAPFQNSFFLFFGPSRFRGSSWTNKFDLLRIKIFLCTVIIFVFKDYCILSILNQDFWESGWKMRLLWSLSRHLSVNLWTGAMRTFWIWRENKTTKVTDINEACLNQVTAASWVYLFSVTPADIVAPCRVFSFACCLMKKGTVTLRERVFYVRKILNFHSVSLKLNLNRSTLEPSRFSPLWCHKRSRYLTIAKTPKLGVGSSPSVVFNLLKGLTRHQFLEFFHD